MLNEEGGHQRPQRSNFISLDDGYSPPKTVEQVRKLVEQDEVLFRLRARSARPSNQRHPPNT